MLLAGIARLAIPDSLKALGREMIDEGLAAGPGRDLRRCRRLV